MRITFLTPRLPPACCGLADHSRLLAAAMKDQGAVPSFIAVEAFPPATDLPGPAIHWDMKSARLWPHVQEFHPDWLWVQLSNYGYSRWGTPTRLFKELRMIKRQSPSIKIAICVHETHCRPSQLGWKGPILAPLQRHSVAAVARIGDLVFPTNPMWVKRVTEEYHVNPSHVLLLPIGANVPPSGLTASERRDQRRSFGWGAEEFIAVTFGSYSSQLRALKVFDTVLDEGIRRNKLDRVVCVGGDSSLVPDSIDEFRKSRDWAKDRLTVLGPSPAHELGKVLAGCDLGLVQTPRVFVTKSGSFMAMAQEGLGILSHRGSYDVTEPGDHIDVYLKEDWDWSSLDASELARRGLQLQAVYRARFDWPVLAHTALSSLRAACL